MEVKNGNTKVMSASTLIGDSVRNKHGEDLGKIEDFMIDLDTGKIAYAVLSFGGILGMGDKLFAVPLNAMELDQDDHEFVLDVEKEKLKEAPGFDKDDWPDMANQEWGKSVFSYYDTEPYWA